MLDKAHCMINMDDEEEYLDFYDFTKSYENHPDAVMPPKEERKVAAKIIEENDSEESWDDCDEQSLDPAEIDEGFEIVDESESSFQVVESKLGSSPGKSGTQAGASDSKSFSIVDKPESAATSVDFSSLSKQFKPKVGTGKTREEVLLGLDVKRAQLLANGEVKLGSGKIIGARRYKHIYRQKLAPADSRESAIIGKLQLEYKKAMALKNGGVGDSLGTGYLAKQAFSEKVKGQKAQHAYALKTGMLGMVNRKHFRDPTATL